MRRIVVLACLAGAGCFVVCPEADCIQTAVELHVTDADTRQPITTATVFVKRGGEWVQVGEHDCGGGRCHVYEGSDSVQLAVRAEGHAEAVLEVEIPRDFCGVVVGQTREVALQKAGSLRSPIVADGRELDSCS